MNKSKMIATNYYKNVTLRGCISFNIKYKSNCKLPFVTKRHIDSCAKCCKIRSNFVRTVFCDIMLIVIEVLLFSLRFLIFAKKMQRQKTADFVHKKGFLTNSYLKKSRHSNCVHRLTCAERIYVKNNIDCPIDLKYSDI